MLDLKRLPLKLCLIKYELDMNFYNFFNIIFQLWFLGIFTAGLVSEQFQT